MTQLGDSSGSLRRITHPRTDTTRQRFSRMPMRHTGTAARACVLVAIAATGCGAKSDPGTPHASPANLPPDSRTRIPSDIERYIHRTLHRLPTWCARGRADRVHLDDTSAKFIELYRRFPAERFRMTIDDESGSMLSAILVLRDELSRCSPRHAALIDPVLPPEIRRALRPLHRVTP